MKYSDIKWVKVLHSTKYDFDYCFTVKTKNLELREYINFENGKTCMKEYPVNNLPMVVKRFIENHNRELFSSEMFEVETYIYK